eukprot:3349989-Prymnesium_polylepis.1
MCVGLGVRLVVAVGELSHESGACLIRAAPTLPDRICMTELLPRNAAAPASEAKTHARSVTTRSYCSVGAGGHVKPSSSWES